MLAKSRRAFGLGSFKPRRNVAFVSSKKQFGTVVKQGQLKANVFNERKRESLNIRGIGIRRSDVKSNDERPSRKRRGARKGKRQVFVEEGKRSLDLAEKREIDILKATDRGLKDSAVVDMGGGGKNLVLISNLKKIREVLRRKKQKREDPAAALKKLMIKDGT